MARTRTRSSVGQSWGLIIPRSGVQVPPGPPSPKPRRMNVNENQIVVYQPNATDRPLQRILPRPLSYYRRQGTLPDRCIAERPRQEVLWLHKDGRGRDSRHQEVGVRGDGERRRLRRGRVALVATASGHNELRRWARENNRTSRTIRTIGRTSPWVRL